MASHSLNGTRSRTAFRIKADEELWPRPRGSSTRTHLDEFLRPWWRELVGGGSSDAPYRR